MIKDLRIRNTNTIKKKSEIRAILDNTLAFFTVKRKPAPTVVGAGIT